MDFNSLPEETKLKILCLLPPQDLKTVMLVCKAWKQSGLDHTLWTWARIKINRKEEFQKITTGRCQLVQLLVVSEECVCDCFSSRSPCLWGEEAWKELFEMMQDMPQLRKVDGLELRNCRTDFYSVEPELMLNVYQKLEKLDLGGNLADEQMVDIFRAIAGNMCLLKCLNLTGPTYGISHELFANAICNVEEVRMSSDGVSLEQMKHLFTAITRYDRKLSKLELNGWDGISRMEAGMVGKAVNRLEEFRTEKTWLSGDKIGDILQRVLEDGSKLQILWLEDLGYLDCDHLNSGGYYVDLDPALVSLVVKKIGRFFPSDYEDFIYLSETDSDEYEEDFDPGENEEDFDLSE